MTKQITEAGVYRDVSFEEYLKIDAVNSSSLKHSLRSVAHYVDYMTRGREPTPAMSFGSLAHCGQLEPLKLAERYAILPDFENRVTTADGSPAKNPKATKAYKDMVAEFERVNENKTIVTQQEFDRMLGVAKSVSETCPDWFVGGMSELTIVWNDERSGLLCKARVDYYKPGHITDLKTAADASAFERAIANYDYDIQGAFYLDGARAAGLEAREFRLCAVESEQPHGCRAAPLGRRTIQDGRRRYRKALELIAEYKTTGIVAGYTSPDAWDKPDWAFRSEPVEVTIGGEVLSI